MLLAIRFFEPLFGALIVVPFFGLPPWLLRFKLASSLKLEIVALAIVKDGVVHQPPDLALHSLSLIHISEPTRQYS